MVRMKRTLFFVNFLLFLLLPVPVRLTAQTTLLGWGDNRYGQLGIGTFDAASPFGKNTPTTVPNLTNLIGLADGFYHSVALASDGTVWTWGYNYYGQLGSGTVSTTVPFGSSTPTQVSSLTGIVSVSAGQHHSLALKNDGTVWAWGWNSSGQLGDGSTTNRSAPVQVSGLTDVKAIAAGGAHSLALKNDGTVWAWGSNLYGQIGDGTLLTRFAPRQILINATAISCGQYHNLAILSDGTVQAWGANGSGQLGIGTMSGSLTPQAVSGLVNVVFVAGGAYTSLAIKSDGSVFGWGWNSFGQVGDGTTIDRSKPVAVQNMTGATAIASGQAHSLALKSDGTVWAWGWNAYGQIGDGTFTTLAPFGVSIPKQISGISGAVGIAGGGNRAHALTSTAPQATLTGYITLENLTLPIAPHTLNLVFRPQDGSAGFVRSATLGPDGDFSIPDVPRKSYVVWVKAAKWLARTVAVDATNGDVTNISAFLPGGDSNNDNVVDISDFGALVNAWNSSAGSAGSGYNSNADFDEDGAVDIADFGILVNNYNQQGEP